MEKEDLEPPFRLGILLPKDSSKKLLYLADKYGQEPYALVRGAIDIMWKVEFDDVE